MNRPVGQWHRPGPPARVCSPGSARTDRTDRTGDTLWVVAANGARQFELMDYGGYIHINTSSTIARTHTGMNALPDGAASSHARTAGTAQFVGFRLADQNYVFRIERIREIVIPTGIASLPEVPACIDGVSNLRGTIIPIVNLRVLFGLARRPIDAETRTIVVNVGQRVMGCIVDSVSRVMRIAADQIQPAHDAVLASGRGFIEGFARAGDELFIVLDSDQLLDPSRLDEVQRTAMARPTDLPPVPGAA